MQNAFYLLRTTECLALFLDYEKQWISEVHSRISLLKGLPLYADLTLRLLRLDSDQ